MLAANDKLGRITSSPWLILRVFKANSRAEVPLVVATENPPPRYSEKFFSNRFTEEPAEDIQLDFNTSKTLFISLLSISKFIIGNLLKLSMVEISFIIFLLSTNGIHLYFFLFFYFEYEKELVLYWYYILQKKEIY